MAAPLPAAHPCPPANPLPLPLLPLQERLQQAEVLKKEGNDLYARGECEQALVGATGGGGGGPG